MSFLFSTIRKYWIDLAIVALISSFFCLYGLGDNSFSDGDQTIHAKVTQEMVHSGNWWTPTRRGIPYFSKPPFQMWLSAIVVSIVGETTAAFRLVSAFSGIATYVFIFLFAICLFRDRRTAWLSFILLLGSRRIMFAHGFREAVQDGMLYFLTTLTMYFFWNVFVETEKSPLKTSRRAYIYSVLGGITVGLAILTKHAAGLLPMLIIGVFLLVTRRLLPILKNHWRPLLLAFFLSLLVPGCFFVPHMLQSWSVFNVMFYHEIYKRATVGYHYRHNTWLYVYEIFHNRGTVPPELLSIAIIWGGYLCYKKKDVRMAFLLCWAIVPVALFTPMRSRLMWYISPAIPGICLLSAATLNMLLTISIDRLHQWKKFTRIEQFQILFVLAFSVFSIFASIKSSGRILRHILNSEQHNSADIVTSEILRLSPDRFPNVVASYKSPMFARYEEFYWARVGLDNRKNVDLDTIATDQSIQYVLATPDAAAEIFPKRKVTGYAIFPPRLSRNRWLTVLTFVDESKLPADFKSTRRALNLHDKNIFTVGWSSLNPLQSNVNENTNKGGLYFSAPDAKLKIQGDYFLRTFGGILEISIVDQIYQSTPQTLKIKFNGTELPEIKISTNQQNTFSVLLPVKLWDKERNILTLTSSDTNTFRIDSVALSLNYK